MKTVREMLKETRRSRSVNQPITRKYLIKAALDFVAGSSQMRGIERMALIGSICTAKPNPKDVDVLVTIFPFVDMERLATLGRRLKGTTQRINCGADIFLADPDGRYLGRICHWKDCRPGVRMSCQALNCGRLQYLCDDLQFVKLDPELIANPPIVIYPQIIVRDKVSDDLMDKVRMSFEAAGPH